MDAFVAGSTCEVIPEHQSLSERVVDGQCDLIRGGLLDDPGERINVVSTFVPDQSPVSREVGQ